MLQLLSIPIQIQEITHPLLTEKEVRLSVLRLDAIHPVISGNKLFKLFYYLHDLAPGGTIITFGGNYSNHLAATAAAGKMMGARTVGFVRGYQQQGSHTLDFCRNNGMELHFMGRQGYGRKTEEEFLAEVANSYKASVIIPEGGYGLTGAKGAALIAEHYKGKGFTHIIAGVGTATTLAGLLVAAEPLQRVVGISVLKDLEDFGERMFEMTGTAPGGNYTLSSAYHFGGYAKKNSGLLDFMNQFYRDSGIPTDFVYTGKMLFGTWDMIKNGAFSPGSNILAIHTGGLQGNLSLPAGTLIFESN